MLLQETTTSVLGLRSPNPVLEYTDTSIPATRISRCAMGRHPVHDMHLLAGGDINHTVSNILSSAIQLLGLLCGRIQPSVIRCIGHRYHRCWPGY